MVEGVSTVVLLRSIDGERLTIRAKMLYTKHARKAGSKARLIRSVFKNSHQRGQATRRVRTEQPNLGG